MMHWKLSFSTWRLEKERHQYRPTGARDSKWVSDKTVQQMEETLCRESMTSLLEEWRLPSQEGNGGMGSRQGLKARGKGLGTEVWSL